MAITKVCDYRENDIGNPRGEHGWRVGVDGKCGTDGLQHDVGETQCQTDAKVKPHAALALP